jgi:hypothetical protein
VPNEKFRLLAQLSQLRTFSDFFAVKFIVKPCVSFVSLGKNGRVETKHLPFDPGVLAICGRHVSAQQ